MSRRRPAAAQGSRSALPLGGRSGSPALSSRTAFQFFEFQRALRQGVAYANVHTVNFPGGEIRGQVRVVE